MNETGRMLVLLGLLLAGAGLLFILADKWPLRELFSRLPEFLRPGSLPGDIRMERGNVSFSFPVVTCLVASIVLSLLFSLFRR